MNDTQDIAVLKAEIKALKCEVSDLKEFIRSMYHMLSEEGTSDYYFSDQQGGADFGRYNT